MGFLAGTGGAVITPPLGAPLLGPTLPATGVHDDLYARVLVLSDGSMAAALVSLDLVGLGLGLAEEIRAAVRQRVPALETVLLLCSHTHSAPFTIPWSVLGWQWMEGEGRPWRDALAPAVTGAVARAAAGLCPVKLSAGRSPVRVGTNRRLPTANGVVMAPNADGALVPWTDVLRVDHAAGGVMALLFTHAAHPVIVHGASTLVSADYPGYAAAAVRERLGESVVAMFAQGCGGNVNGDPLRGGFGAAEAAGRALAEAAVRACADAEPIPDAPLRAGTVDRSLPLQDLPDVAECRRAVDQAEEQVRDAEARGTEGTALWYLRDTVCCYRNLLRRAECGAGQGLPFMASALSIGEHWCLAAMTHEVFADYQLWLDGTSPFRHTMAAAYTNGCESYLPTDAALAEGGYEGVSYPASGAAMRYPYRVAVRPGAEGLVKGALAALLTGRHS